MKVAEEEVKQQATESTPKVSIPYLYLLFYGVIS